MDTFDVKLERTLDDSYQIMIGRNLMSALISDLSSHFQRFSRYALITDSSVNKIYGKTFLSNIRSANFKCELISVPAGESTKTRETKSLIEDQMLSMGYGRDSCIIALGGGMVSDLAGFIASTFCRGIPYINYSTTLLSAADASVGGKTAVNTPVATNLIGTFYQPRRVYIDIDMWRTLPLREFRSGLAETIKHACMADYDFFEYLENNISLLIDSDRLVLDPSVCEYVARKNCEIKYKVVEQDEKESNIRQILNLGHTVGRAIETLSNYKLLHGEAVAIGLSVQCRLAHELGFISREECDRVNDLLKKAGFNIQVPKYIEVDTLVDKMHTDKKVRNGKIKFVLMSRIGGTAVFEDGSCTFPIEEATIRDIICKAFE